MKQGTIDLLNSERGTLCVLLVLAATILAIIGLLAVDEWVSYTKWIATVLVASKTVTAAVETMRSNQPPPLATASITETKTVTASQPTGATP